MSHTKSLLLFFLAIFVLLLPYNNTLLAEEESGDVLPLALDMFKFDQYLPALDMLEANIDSNKDNFNYWLYIGLARQRTKQLNKALEAYEKAFEINPDANNLKIRINNLKKAISNIDEAQIKDFKTNEEKAQWLLEEADSLRRDKKEEKAFRTFIQAVEYDVKMLGNDKNFIRRGVVYYKLKVEDEAEYSKLFYAIFKYFEGEISEAYKYIKKFRDEDSKKPLTIQKMENEYFKKLAEANNQQKDYEIAEREEKRKKELEKEQAKKAKAESKQKSSKDKSSAKSNDKVDIRNLEREINNETFTTIESSNFEKRYIKELASFKIEEYFSIQDERRKNQILWELSRTGSTNEDVMKVYIDALHQEDIECVSNSLRAINSIGMPLAEKAYPSMLELLNSDRRDFKYFASESLGRLGIHPEVVIPKIISVYGDEDIDALRKHYVSSVQQFGKIGLDIAYKVLDEKPRLERLPVALFIHDMTGEKVEDLINK
jgi:tetratricopeptide (TPR) repeat protein